MDGLDGRTESAEKAGEERTKNRMNTDIWFLLDFDDCLHVAYMEQSVPLPLLREIGAGNTSL